MTRDAERVLRRMWGLGHQITLELDPARVLARFLEAAIDIAQADGGVLGMLGEDGQLRIANGMGPGGAHLAGGQFAVTSPVMYHVVRTREAWKTDDARAEPQAFSESIRVLIASEGIRSVAMVPITRRADVLGLVAVVSLQPGAFTADDLDRLSAMGDLLSVALANAELVESLRQAEWRFRTLFRAAPDAVLTLLESGRVRDANDAVRNVFGLDPVHVVGRLLTDLVAAEDRLGLSAVLEGAFQGRPGRIEVAMLPCAAGEGLSAGAAAAPPDATRIISFAVSRLPESDPPSVLLIGRDMTGEREMRARLMETDRLAAVGELVAGVAHEVNNPLSSISAFAQLLLRDASLSDSQRESIEVIRSETTRASHVVKDLLAFARRSDPHREPLDLNAVVTRSLRLRQYEVTLHGVQVDTGLEGDLPAVIGDARQLQQVCLNLLNNAIQAVTGRRGAQVQLTTRSEGDRVLFEVSDNGPGIPPGVRARIFEPFFTTKPEGQGTGLGLSVSYGIVAAHGGAITVVDTAAGGTTFRVALPAAGGPATGGLLPHDAARLPSRSPLAGLRLLFVDDEPALRASMEAYAALRGLEVITCADGREALGLLHSTAVDAIVCDLRMPGIDGLALHERLRQARPGLAARMVFITGDVVTAELRISTRQPIIAKPFGFEQLEEVILAVLRGTSVPTSGPAGGDR